MVEFDIVCTLPTSSNFTNAHPYYNYSRTDWDGMLEFLAHYNFNPIYNFTDINLKWQFIKDILLDAASQFAPVSKPKLQRRPKWFNSEIKHKFNCIHTIRRKTDTRPTPHNTAKLKAPEKNLSLTMENAKRSYKASLVELFIN